MSDDQSYSPIATSEMFMQRVKFLQRVISKHDLFGELAMEHALGTAGKR